MLRKTFLAILVLITIFHTPVNSISENKGLYIVVTFPNLVRDLENIVCSGDEIVSIAPLGVDPHEYSLTPKNIEDLGKADLIISTAHAPFEYRIREMVLQHVFKATYIEIPSIPGIMIKKNPMLDKPNYHMPIYDPYNYIVFLRYVVKKMSSLNPRCSSYYYEKLEEIVNRVEKIVNETRTLNVKAIADTPVTQYSVEWIGVDIVYLVVKEHGVQAQPDIRLINEMIGNGTIGLIVVLNPPVSKYSKWLIDIGKEHGLPILYIPSPMNNMSMVERLEIISDEINNIYGKIVALHRTISVDREYGVLQNISFITGAVLFILMIYVLVGGRRGS